jgi:hypothetical protein
MGSTILSDEEVRGNAADALHSIRNRFCALFGFAELAHSGSSRAQQLLVQEILRRCDFIRSQLDVIDAAIQRTL